MVTTPPSAGEEACRTTKECEGMRRSAHELQAIIEEQMPGFQLVHEHQADASPSTVDADEGTPDLLPPDSDDRPQAETEAEHEDELVKVVPKHVAETPEAVRHTKTVLISADGTVFARQG
jgi:hypothetical protein